LKLSDLTGQVKISAHHARTLMGTWFDPEDKIVIVGRKSEKTGKNDTLSQSMTAAEFCEFTDEDLESLIFDEDGTKYNLYFGVCPVIEDVTLTKRGSEENVSHVPGVWADLDVKEKGFGSKEEIIQYLYGLALRPTIVVGSGSGGIHAYWKLAPGEKGNKELVERWWSYLDEAAGPSISIDKLADMTRILRIPGTVYFPKPDSGSKVGAVEIMYKVDDTYTIDQITQVSQEAYDIKVARRRRLINQDANRRLDMDSFARNAMGGLGNNKWRMLRAISELEDYVNQKMEWAEILEPHGWKWQRTLSDGSNEWARPGRDERSAVVDYEDSPVMSLLSMSEETGLADLKDAHIPITKYRAFLRLQFGDDNEKDMVNYLIGRLEEEGII
jgi:hypothetical protein